MIFDCNNAEANLIETNEKNVSIYFNEVKKYPILTSSEERQLMEIVKNETGKKAEIARNKIVECNQRFVISAARKRQNGENFLDLVNEGNLGLMAAIEHFDLTKKQRFLTYAVFWIRKAINDYISGTEASVHTMNSTKVYTYASKARNTFFMKNERYPTTQELKEEIKIEFGVTIPYEEDLEKVIVTSIEPTMIDDEDSDNVYDSEFNVATATNNTEDDINRQYEIDTARELISTLDEREMEVVKSYYGIDGRIQKSYELIGRDLGICKERVRQIMNEAMAKMSKNVKPEMYEN